MEVLSFLAGNADRIRPLERNIQINAMASRSGSHRSRRPGHVDQGMTRELVKVFRFPKFESADQQRSDPPWESTARSKLLPGKALTARPIHRT